MKLNITLPCYNEDKILNNNVIELFDFLNKNIAEDDWQIIIADNNSTDNTAKIAQELTKKFDIAQETHKVPKNKGFLRIAAKPRVILYKYTPDA